MITQDLTFYGVDRERLIDSRPIYRRLSGNFLSFPMPEQEFLKEGNSFLVRNFYSLFKYVTEEDKPFLNVDIKTNNSFCSLTSNHIQLGTGLMAMKMYPQQMKVDTLFAIMVHEMLHKRYTLADIASKYPKAQVGTDTYYKNISDFLQGEGLLNNKLKLNIWNILEDYRIERNGLKEYPGYVFHFEQSREYAIHLHSNMSIDKARYDSMPLEYLMIRVLLPEMTELLLNNIHMVAAEKIKDSLAWSDIAPKCNVFRTLHIIKRIEEYISTHKRFVFSSDFDDVLRATGDIYNLFSKDDAARTTNNLHSLGMKFDSVFKEFVASLDMTAECGKYSNVVDEGEINEAIDEAVENATRLLSGDGSNDIRIEGIPVINENSATFEFVEIEKMKPGPVDNNILSAAQKYSRDIIKNIGSLAAKLNRDESIFELDEGEIDEDELYSIGFNDMIFKEENVSPGVEFDLWILIDESGSMSDNRKRDTAVIAALTFALSVIGSSVVNLYVYGHAQRDVKAKMIQMYEYYNLKKRVSNWKNLFSVGCNGGNADGYAIAKIGDMMKQSKARRKLLIVVSDGKPMASGYGGELAFKHVHDVVCDLERSGIKTVQICLDNFEDSNKMFKHIILYTNKQNFINQFVALLQKELVSISNQL